MAKHEGTEGVGEDFIGSVWGASAMEYYKIYKIRAEYGSIF